jgi:hypothetical protein
VGSTSRLCILLWLSVGGCASTTPPLGGGGDGGGSGDLSLRDLSVADLATPVDLKPPPDLTPTCMATGAPCNTGQQGVCAAGHQGCVGNSPACVQDVNPTAESCLNDLDDDCNGTINNGCAIAVSLGTPRALPAVGGAGGGAASIRCPANTWVVHTEFWFDRPDATASGVHIYCATPTLQRGAGGYSITLGAKINVGEWKGGAASNLDGQIDCGTVGAVAGWGTRGTAGAYVFGMGMDCASASLTLGANNQLTASFAKNGNGNYWFYPGGTAYEVNCAAGEALVGYDGRVGSWMDQLQPICAPLIFAYRP